MEKIQLRLILASRNAHKLREFGELLGPGFFISDLSDAGNIPPVEETGATFEANAILKAVAISQRWPDLVVSDDSGLEVDVLGGAPGVRSARYAGEGAKDQENVAQLLAALGAIDPSPGKARARFRCVIALAEGGKVLQTFDGVVHGSIVGEARGRGGFGYDPIFVPEGYDETFAELGALAKNRISHRARAITGLREYLTTGRSAP